MNYWKSVGHRLLSLTKQVVDAAAPAAVDYAVESLINKACQAIELKLKELYKKTAVNSAINFVLNLAGVLLFVLKPFGLMASTITGSVFFAAAIVFTLVRFILYCKNYGKLTVGISKSILKERSINKGIACFVRSQFPTVSMIYTGIDLFSIYIPALNRIPQLEETVSLFIRLFWKRIITFIIILSVYTITVFWIIKPIILMLWA